MSIIFMFQGCLQKWEDLHSDPLQGGAYLFLLSNAWMFYILCIQVNKFQLAYCNLLKSNMDGLKRQKKQKTKKATQ